MHLPDNTVLQGGKYQIKRFISSGGFGCTYEGWHLYLKRRVAIKEFFVGDFCNRDENSNTVSVGIKSKAHLVEKLREKFMDEARSVCELEHPGIVKVHDVFPENGTAYYVMDYIDGPSLQDIVKQRGRLSEQEAVGYIRQLCDALGYVHKNNRLHLDIKPGNIMVNNKGRAVLIDFGASKQYDEVNGENTSTLMGKTPGYAPLEQMGNSVSKFLPATDIYAVGATLYKLLTGNTPPASNILAAGAPLPPLPDGLSNGVYKAVSAAMSHSVAKRPQSIEEFLALLDDNSINQSDITVIDIPTPPVVVPVEPDPTPDPTQMPNPYPTPDVNGNDDQPSRKKMVMLGLSVAVGVALLIIVGSLLWRGGSKSEPVPVPDDSVAQQTERTEQTGQTKQQPKTVENAQIILYGDEKVTYTGEVNAEGIPDGEGVAKFTDATYQGHFANGHMDGKGLYKFGSGSFDGTFDNDRYVEGRLTYYGDGSYFEGKFKGDEPYNGTYYDKSGNVISKVVNGNRR